LIARSPSGSVLLTWRDDDDFGPGWHIPGGVIRLKELAVNRVILVAKNEIQADIASSEAKLVHLHEHISINKIRGHGYSLLYEYLMSQSNVFKYEEFNSLKKYKRGDAVWHACIPDLFIKEQMPLKHIIFGEKIDSGQISSSQEVFY
jgi:colanic acid biosynthesis protein WcaH